jgi:hypothetical protein
MTRARLIFCIACTVVAVALAPFSNAQSSVIANAPVKNFRLPSFNDEGHRTSLLRGSEARYTSANQIDIIELNFAQFRGDGTTETNNILLAPSASVLLKEQNQIVLTGRESMRLINKDLEATGENWSYDHTDRRLIINQNVRVVFRAELTGLLD